MNMTITKDQLARVALALRDHATHGINIPPKFAKRLAEPNALHDIVYEWSRLVNSGVGHRHVRITDEYLSQIESGGEPLIRCMVDVAFMVQHMPSPWHYQHPERHFPPSGRKSYDPRKYITFRERVFIKLAHSFHIRVLRAIEEQVGALSP